MTSTEEFAHRVDVGGASGSAATASRPLRQNAVHAVTVPNRSVTRITAHSPWYETGLGELMRSHELLLAFTWRLIGVQYKQAILGVGWAVINPIMSTVVFTLIFGKLASIPSEGLPYPLFVLSGLITWQYFARAVGVGSSSIVVNSHIITKVYFPRMILPFSCVLASLMDYAINLAVLLTLMALYGRAPHVELLLLPVFLMLTVMMGFAISLWLSSLHAIYRDFGFAIPLALQVWMFLTPVVYPGTLVPSGWAWLLDLNPMTVVIQGARWAVLPESTPPDALGLAIFAVELCLLFLGGIIAFHKIDAILADRI
jgi:lipopolysaccharide transport system permease protein